MILIYCFFFAILSVIAIIVTMNAFGHTKNPVFRRGLLWSVIVSLVLGLFCMILGGIYANDVANLKNDYNDLMLYYNTVNNSTNEYVRYDYYDKVTTYNLEFKEHQIASKNDWFGGLYPRDWDADLNLISFQLHGDEYVE